MPPPAPSILLVEDDPEAVALFTDVLRPAGYVVSHVSTAVEAEQRLTQIGAPLPDLVILDLMLPDASGLVLCADLKRRVDVPILICSATARRDDPVLGFKLGADDFLAKPFNSQELRARVEAVLRRTRLRLPHRPPSEPVGPPLSPSEAPDLIVGALLISRVQRLAQLGGVTLDLTPAEYRLLRELAEHAGQMCSRQQLWRAIHGYVEPAGQIGRAVDLHVHRLREKLRAAAATAGVPAPVIGAVQGAGYRLDSSG